MTETLHLDVFMLLPHLPDEPDACVQRLEELIARAPGVEECRVRDSETGPVLVARYDPGTLTVAQVQRLAQEAGEEVTETFGHMLLSMPKLMGSEAHRIEDSLRALPGVVSVSVSPPSWVRIEFLRHDISAADIVHHFRLLGQSDVAPINPSD